MVEAITTRRFKPKEECSDCGQLGTTTLHKGPMVPDNQVGKFCQTCWNYRQNYYAEQRKALPLGWKIKVEQQKNNLPPK